MPIKKRSPLTDAIRIGAMIPPAGKPLLPHERDESLSAPAPPEAAMTQAQRDVARGLEDTDCYTRLGKSMPRVRRK